MYFPKTNILSSLLIKEFLKFAHEAVNGIIWKGWLQLFLMISELWVLNVQVLQTVVIGAVFFSVSTMIRGPVDKVSICTPWERYKSCFTPRSVWLRSYWVRHTSTSKPLSRFKVARCWSWSQCTVVASLSHRCWHTLTDTYSHSRPQVTEWPIH